MHRAQRKVGCGPGLAAQESPPPPLSAAVGAPDAFLELDWLHEGGEGESAHSVGVFLLYWWDHKERPVLMGEFLA